MNADPRTVDAIRNRFMAVHFPFVIKSHEVRQAADSFADALAELREMRLEKRNPWKRPPWQIGRRKCFFFDAKKARRESRIKHEEELYWEWQSDIASGMRGH